MNRFILAIFVLFVGFSAHAQSYKNAVRAFEQDRPQTAVRDLTTLAREGHTEAQFFLAEIYRVGKKGIVRDARSAARLYREAAGQGHALAQYNLGKLYSLGNGVPESPFHAYMWYSIAATNNYKQAYKDIERLGSRLSSDKITDAKIQAVQCYSSNYRFCD